MLATLTISGSGALSTQTACGRSARTIRSATIRCSRRSLSLRSSCSPRWSSTAGSELRRVEPASATVETLAPERRTSSSGLAPRKAASGVPQQKQKQEGNCSRIAPNSAAGSCRGGADNHLAGEHHLAHLPRSDPGACRIDRPLELARRSGAADLGVRGGMRVEQRQRVGAQSRQPSGQRGAACPPTSSPGPTTALSVRNVSSPLRHSESSGRLIEPGENEDQVEEAPPAGSKAKPPTQTGPAPAGSPAGSSRTRLPRPQALVGDVVEAALATRGRLVCDPEARQRELAVGLLPAEPAIRRQPRGEYRGAGVDAPRPAR